MRVLMHCAANGERRVTKAEIAQACNSSQHHLAQIINQLGQMGLLRTVRGRGGGLTLGLPAARISVGRVFRALESDAPLAECFSETDNTCPLVAVCQLRDALKAAHEAFHASLDPITLEGLMRDNAPLRAYLRDPRHQRGEAAPPCPTAATPPSPP